MVILWVPPLGILSAALLAHGLGASTVVVAVVGGILLGSYGALDEVLLPLRGIASYNEGRAGAEWGWFAVALAAKIALVVVAFWLILSGAALCDRGGLGLGAIVLIAGLIVMRLAHRPTIVALRRARSLRQVPFGLKTDPDSFLLLRSFSDDSLTMRTMMAAGGVDAPVFPVGRLRFEEHLTRLLQTSGRVVAIGRPGERLPELGAVRTYWPDSEWQDQVRLTASRARAVVLVAGASDGLAWELSHLREWGLLGKTLIVLPPDPDAKRSTERFHRVWTELHPEGSAPAEFLPGAWVGLRFMPDGHVLHYLADGRDWMSYTLLTTFFYNELMGHDHTLRFGAMKDQLDLVDGIEKASSLEQAAQMVRESDWSFRGDTVETQTWSIRSVEKVRPVALAR